MTPPDEPPSNPYDPNWPKPETPPQSAGNEPPSSPYGQPTESPYTQPYGQQPPSGEQQASPYPPYGQQQPWGQAPQAPQAQPGWGQQQQPYGQVPYGTPTYGAPLTPHPSATTAMVLGIGALGGMVLCVLPILLAPFAWMVGGRAVKEIDANPGRYSGRDQAQAGRIMGMIGTGLLVLGIIAIIAFVALAFAASESSDLTYDPDTGYTTSDPAF